MLSVQKILCPTDFSEPSYSGVEIGNELAAHFNAELILINVIPPPLPLGAPGVPASYKMEEYYRDMTEFAEESLENLIREKISDNVKVRTIVEKGNVPDEIVKNADAEKTDIIVISTHGWSGWRHLVFGSVAEKVIRLAQCRVLAVPQPEESP